MAFRRRLEGSRRMIPQRGTWYSLTFFSLSPTLEITKDPHYQVRPYSRNNKKTKFINNNTGARVHRPSEEVNGGLSADDAHARVTIINTITRRHHDRMEIAEQFRAVSREIEKSGYK